MLILSIDTSTRAGSRALMQDDRVLREQAGDAAREQSERLPGELEVLLAQASVELADIDAFAVATGPGSFTGLRVGIATMQGLAMATGKPLVGVSAFDALAHMERGATLRQAGHGRPTASAGAGWTPLESSECIAMWIDAWRGEVFAAVHQEDCEMDAPAVARPEDLLARLKGRRVVFTGDGAARYQALIRATLGERARFADPASPLLAGAVARLAGAALQAGERPSPHAIRPIYVRRSDAELARDARGV